MHADIDGFYLPVTLCFAVAGVAVERGILMSSGALPGPDLVRARAIPALEGL